MQTSFTAMCALALPTMVLAVVASAQSVVATQAGSRAAAPATSEETNARPHPQKVYKVGFDVTAPELVPANFTTASQSDCRDEQSGKVRLSLIVDESGKVRDIFFLQPLGNSLDRLAMGVVAADHFISGKHDGTPVAVAMLIDLKLEGCSVAVQSASGESLRVRLRSLPVQTLSPNKDVPSDFVLDDISTPAKNAAHHIGPGGVTAPVPVITPVAKEHNKGTCLISLIVDASGLPESIRVVRSITPEIDQKALEAVEGYRFRPAFKNGHPVAVNIVIEVSLGL